MGYVSVLDIIICRSGTIEFLEIYNCLQLVRMFVSLKDMGIPFSAKLLMFTIGLHTGGT